MPIYEYQCQQCGHQVEILQGISEAPLTLCPKCQQTAMTKLISNTSFQLKGSGWYKTDYASKPQAATSATAKSDEAAPTTAAPETKSSDQSSTQPNSKAE